MDTSPLCVAPDPERIFKEPLERDSLSPLRSTTPPPVEETADIVVRHFDDTEVVAKKIASTTDKIMSFISSRHGKVNSPTLQREFKITLEKARDYIEQWKIFQ